MATKKSYFPNLLDLTTLYHQNQRMQEIVLENVTRFRRIHGGLRLAEKYQLHFDPRRDYWHLPERRILIAYFSKKWHQRYAPANDLRRHTLGLFQHFESSREAGEFEGWYTVEYDELGGWDVVSNRLIEVAGQLPRSKAFDSLRMNFSKGVKQRSPSEHLIAFLERTQETENWPSKFEAGFSKRLPWFPYLGTTSLGQLRERQAFFYGYTNLLTSTNSYNYGGAQNFAPVIQNTNTTKILDFVTRWRDGESPDDTGFSVLGVDEEDDFPQDRSHYTVVIELFGFLNLHRAPYYNNQTAQAYIDKFIPDDNGEITPYQLVDLAGRETLKFLKKTPRLAKELDSMLSKLCQEPLSPTNLLMEGLHSSQAAQRIQQTPDVLVDGHLLDELIEAAKEHIDSLSDIGRAACMLHIMLDANLYLQDGDGGGVISKPEQSGELLKLPFTLHDYGERALAYLHAGLHVLFAGAPGTGKTTLAQFVGYAWNRGLETLPEEIPIEDLPLTTVGNSAWSPFHTIGGLRPQPDGTFVAQPGIFIDAQTTEDGQWKLRSEAIVLDEMNRADLDRCIGELYPLLSGSVQKVSPAGIPGIQTIGANDKFRVISTINDSTLDDIVFPISEGLARRFQRIALPGASEADLFSFLDLEHDVLDDEHKQAADEAVRAFFSLAGEKELLQTSEGEDRLSYGAGYFALLKKWVHGELKMPATFQEQKPRVQALQMLKASLATIARTKGLDEVLQQLLEDG